MLDSESVLFGLFCQYILCAYLLFSLLNKSFLLCYGTIWLFCSVFSATIVYILSLFLANHTVLTGKLLSRLSSIFWSVRPSWMYSG